MTTLMQSSTASPLGIVLATWQDQFKTYLQVDHRKVTRRQLDEKSIQLAAQHLRRFTLWYQAQFNTAFQPNLLTNYDLHLYRKVSLESEKVKAATWNSRFWALGIFCTWIGRPELMDGIEQKSAGRASTKHRSLASDEYHRLIHTIELDPRRALTVFEAYNASRDWAAVALMLFAGLRVEEVFFTQVEDITINERSGNVYIRNGKGSKERNVPLNLMARRALTQYLKDRPQTGPLFDVSIRTLQRAVSDLGQRIEVPDLTCHWLRYHFAKMLEKAGKPIEMIRELLGHSSIEITRRYLRSSMEDLQSAVEEVM